MKFIIRNFEEIEDKGIEVFGIPMVEENTLKRQGIRTVEDLMSNWGKLKTYRGLGAKKVKRIKSAVFEYAMEQSNGRGFIFEDVVYGKTNG